jgi:hypothetical protein
VKELIAFLRARLDEDERIARTAASVGYADLRSLPVPVKRWDTGDVAAHWRDGEGGQSNPSAVHIARWDPARVLADVEANRRILDLHKPWNAGGYHRANTTPAPDRWLCATCDGDNMANVLAPCPTVRLLALPYAEHPDYDPGWAPESVSTSAVSTACYCAEINELCGHCKD